MSLHSLSYCHPLLSGRRKGTLTYSSIYINCVSVLRAWTKLLPVVLQKFRGGKQQYHALLYGTFQTIHMTFSELKIISSVMIKVFCQRADFCAD